MGSTTQKIDTTPQEIQPLRQGMVNWLMSGQQAPPMGGGQWSGASTPFNVGSGAQGSMSQIPTQGYNGGPTVGYGGGAVTPPPPTGVYGGGTTANPYGQPPTTSAQQAPNPPQFNQVPLVKTDKSGAPITAFGGQSFAPTTSYGVPQTGPAPAPLGNPYQMTPEQQAALGPGFGGYNPMQPPPGYDPTAWQSSVGPAGTFNSMTGTQMRGVSQVDPLTGNTSWLDAGTITPQAFNALDPNTRQRLASEMTPADLYRVGFWGPQTSGPTPATPTGIGTPQTGGLDPGFAGGMLPQMPQIPGMDRFTSAFAPQQTQVAPQPGQVAPSLSVAQPDRTGLLPWQPSPATVTWPDGTQSDPMAVPGGTTPWEFGQPITPPAGQGWTDAQPQNFPSQPGHPGNYPIPGVGGVPGGGGPVAPGGPTGQGAGPVYAPPAFQGVPNFGGIFAQQPELPGRVQMGLTPDIDINQIMSLFGAAPNRSAVRDVNAPQTQSVDQLGGVNSPFFNNMMGQLAPAFDQRRAEALAAAKESSGNLTGSGYGNILGAAVNRSLGDERASLANYASQGLQTEVGRQLQQAAMGLQGQGMNQGADLGFLQQMLGHGAQRAGMMGNLALGNRQISQDVYNRQAGMDQQRNLDIFNTLAQMNQGNAGNFLQMLMGMGLGGVQGNTVAPNTWGQILQAAGQLGGAWLGGR